MSKNILNEITRMKDLFGYKKGVVISEQTPTDMIFKGKSFDLNNYPDCVQKFGKPVKMSNNIVGIAGKDEFQGYNFFPLQGDKAEQKGRVAKPDGTMGNYQCFNNKILIDGKELSEIGDAGYVNDKSWKNQKPDANHGIRQCNTNYNGPCDSIWDGYIKNYVKEDMWVKKFGVQVPPKVAGKNNAPKGSAPGTAKQKSTIPQELKDVNGVKAFQDWLDTKAPGWLKKYGTINKDPKKGYGKFGPSTSAAWEKYKGTYFTGKIDYKAPGLTDADAPKEDETTTANTGGIGVPTEDGGETYAPVEKDDF